MLVEINYSFCKGIYFFFYIWREMGRELEIFRVVG